MFVFRKSAVRVDRRASGCFRYISLFVLHSYCRGEHI